MAGVMFALAITAAVEPPIVAAVFPQRRLRMALVALVTTAVTNVAMNLWLARVFTSPNKFVVVGELGAFLVEAAVYYAVSRDLQRAFCASAFANAASFAL